MSHVSRTKDYLKLLKIKEQISTSSVMTIFGGGQLISVPYDQDVRTALMEVCNYNLKRLHVDKLCDHYLDARMKLHRNRLPHTWGGISVETKEHIVSKECIVDSQLMDLYDEFIKKLPSACVISFNPISTWPGYSAGHFH